MRRLIALVAVGLLIVGAVALALAPGLRGRARALLQPEPPPPITPLAVVAPPQRALLPTVPPPPTAAPPTKPAAPTPAASSPAPATAVLDAAPSAAPASPTPPPTAPPPTPLPSPTPGPVEVNGRLYEAYILAATKEGQFFQYSCEFDAAWVIFATYGRDISVDELVGVIGVDGRVEPYIEETAAGFVIHGGDIGSRFSGDYTGNFLARSTGAAFRRVFEHYGLAAEPVRDRAGVEAALRRGALVWMKTTVDFKPWRPAIWRTPEGAEYRTVLGNDHAVVAIGFNSEVVVIRDVLGPTSTNRQRPYEYEVAWETFLASWGAQDFDGLAVEPPR